MKRYVRELFIFLTAFLASGYVLQVCGQNGVCATDEFYQVHARQNRAMLKLQKEMDARWDALQHQQGKTDAVDTQLYIIPVVFHVMYNTLAGNISDNLINATIAQLNTDYRKQNYDTNSIRKAFKPLATDAHIEFRLANKDPFGNCSTGVTRMQTTASVQAGDEIKSYAYWESSKYLNIWVVESINSSAVQGGTILGYSAFPWDAATNSANDGIVVDRHYIGKTQRTLTHETGHYLGLYHTFQDGCSTDQKLQGDHVDDTPPVAAASFGYNTTANTCHTDVPDQLDMIENYMDYSDRKYLFTPAQVYRMRMMVRGMRAELISTANVATAMAVCTTGLEEQAGNAIDLNIFPNPSAGDFILNIGSNRLQSANIQVSDMTGRIIYTSETTINEGNQRINLDKSRINVSKPGVYFISVRTTDGTAQKKLVIN